MASNSSLLTEAKTALRTLGIMLAVCMLILAFYGSIPQAEFTEQTQTTSDIVYTYRIVSAKTVYNRIITVHLNRTVSAAQVTISTWVWVLHAAIHVYVDGREVLQVNTGASGKANAYAPFPDPVRDLTVVVWAHNMAPIPFDFHASVTFS